MNNFWNSCPLKSDYFPSKKCSLGEKSSRITEEEKSPCQWFVNDPSSNFCFWKWTRERSNVEGLMPVCTQSEISELLVTSTNKLNQTYKEALEKLKSSNDLAKLFSQGV